MTARVCNDDLLRMLYPTDMHLAEVAKLVGYNNGCNVTRRAVALGLTKRSDAAVTAKRDAQICRSVENGVPIKDVAALHKISPQRVVAILRSKTLAEGASDVRVKAWSASPAAIAAALAKLQARGVSA